MGKKKMYDFASIERKWQAYWEKNDIFKAYNESAKPKYYVLDMFPYPSGQGLHTGHALGYIASDVVTRYKRSIGYNVLHPMGFDSFGLPAEQYAQEVGQHPKVTTAQNTKRYREQLERLGLALDWTRAVTTSDPTYYRWTQWIFLRLFDAWYDIAKRCASPIQTLINTLAQEGNQHIQAACAENTPVITADEWRNMDEDRQQAFLLHYRLAYLDDTLVNWCPALGTVLANDEVKDGLSERGGHPVVKRKMRQWSLRITAYADRLLERLDELDWSEALKDMQRHWIGRSEGAQIRFPIQGEEEHHTITVFTTCPETIFGVTYLVLAPEHPLVHTMIDWLSKNPLHSQDKALRQYTEAAINLSERQRIQQANHVSGCFTGFYALHPLTKKKLPIWVSEYVLGSYGTGAVMGVPAHDQRDHAFATHFALPIIQTIHSNEEEVIGSQPKGQMIHSDFLDGMHPAEARKYIIKEIQKKGIGESKVQYRLRDTVFSRQRYWGEPFPIYYKNGIPYPMDEKELPIHLPQIDAYKPTSDGEPPLARAKGWKTTQGYPIEYNTMPGWAGSSWYFFRYMDPHNTKTFASPQATHYWQAVDLYIGGAEHATGHLLYARFFTKVLHDLGYITIEEPFRKLINQGMIQATTHFVYRIQGTNQFVSYRKKETYPTTPLRVDHTLVKNATLDCKAFQAWRADFKDATFILEDDGKYLCGQAIEKMSKSKHNAINPDDVIDTYGADTFRLYMMFLGPITQSKPWDTQGIEGIARFIQKIWKLFHSGENDSFHINEEPPSPEAERAIHLTIKSVRESIDRYTFNTAVSSLMIGVNTLLDLSCHSKAILETYVKLLAPFAPHLAEELWSRLGYPTTILEAPIPTHDPNKIAQQEDRYPLAINGKTRTILQVPAGTPQESIEEAALSNPTIQKWIRGRKIQQVIIVPQRMVNIVLQ